MLHEEMTKYRELSGDTNPNTPISRIGGYLDGYERALEQQTCEDAISREDALMALTGEWTELTDELIHRFIKRIKKLPPVNLQPKWIPVSERLPKEDNEVLITIKSCGNWYVCHSVYRDGQFWQKNFEYHSYRKPIAWMPLPKPYKAESEE